LVGHTITAVEYKKYDYTLEQDVVSIQLSDGRSITIYEPEIHGEGKAIAPPRKAVNHAGLFLVKMDLKEFTEELNADTQEHATAD
jgi:hypothetical protein